MTRQRKRETMGLWLPFLVVTAVLLSLPPSTIAEDILSQQRQSGSPSDKVNLLQSSSSLRGLSSSPLLSNDPMVPPVVEGETLSVLSPGGSRVLKGQKGKKSSSSKSGEDYYYNNNNSPVFKSTHRTRTRGKSGKRKGARSGSGDVDLYLATDGYSPSDLSDENYYYQAGPAAYLVGSSSDSSWSSSDSHDPSPTQYNKVKGFKGRSKGGSSSSKTKKGNQKMAKENKYATIEAIQQLNQQEHEHELERAQQHQLNKHKRKYAKKSLKHRKDPGDRKNSHKDSSSSSKGGGSKGGTKKTCNSRKRKRTKGGDNRYRGKMTRINRRGYSNSGSDEHYGEYGYGYASKSERGKKNKKVTDFVYRDDTGRWEPESPGGSVERYYYYGDKGGIGKGSSKGKSKSKGSSKSKNKGRSKGSKGKGGYDDDDDDDDEYYYYEEDDYYYEDDCTESPTFSPYPTFTPFPSYTPFPSTEPSMGESAEMEIPTTNPTSNPTVPPGTPTTAPTMAPTETPTTSPTNAPTVAPTTSPTQAPTTSPTDSTAAPTGAPTMMPTTLAPTGGTDAPTGTPTMMPTTLAPTGSTTAPTGAPTMMPTTLEPTGSTVAPTGVPTMAPTETMTEAPTTVAPTLAPTVATEAPTLAPTMGTGAPTGMLTVVVPFMLTYTLPGAPSDGDLATVEEVTDRFLEEIFNLSYDFDPSTDMEDFMVMLITSTDGSGTVTIDYEATVTFGDGSTVVPTIEEVEPLLASAFDGLNLQVYLDLMQNLGAGSAFSETTDVAYAPVTATTRSTASSNGYFEKLSLTSSEIVGVIGSGIIVILGAAAMVHQSKSRKRRAAQQRKVSLTI